MEQQEYAVGATRVAAGRPDGRKGGAGRGTADAVLAVRGAEASAEAEVEVHAVAGTGADGPQATAEGLSPDPGLLRLAHWFAAATPGTADDLCTASFGLYPARHLGAAAAPADPAVSWWHGPTAHAAAAPRTR
ncbi:DUF2397 family protein, partial [Streptomyces sp. CBMA123]|uniref:DUF2397 family protein n=1 Tax=Streptomyces sp. CBMA123 TaxID=1896313 RepID=UPI001CB85018